MRCFHVTSPALGRDLLSRNSVTSLVARSVSPMNTGLGSVLYLIGSTMDWVEDDFAAGFVFENPNAKGACGCGESFTV